MRREEENIYQVIFTLVTTSLSQTRVMADSMNKDVILHH